MSPSAAWLRVRDGWPKPREPGPTGSSGAASTSALLRAEAERRAAAYSEACEQAMTPADAVADIGMISELHQRFGSRLTASRQRDEHQDDEAGLVLSVDAPAPLSQLLPCCNNRRRRCRRMTDARSTDPTVCGCGCTQFRISPHIRPSIRPKLAEAGTGGNRATISPFKFTAISSRATVEVDQLRPARHAGAD